METKNTKFFDFDAFMEEKRGTEKQFEVKAFGEIYQLPYDVPFEVVLTIKAEHENGNKEMDEDATVKICQAIFGEAAFNSWVSKGIGIKGIMVLTENVMKMYMSNAADMSEAMAERKIAESPTPK